jgi:solute carrier family 25 protein 33/36
MTPCKVGIIPARSAYFYAYQTAKTRLGRLASDKESVWAEGQTANSLLSGLTAGIVGNSLTNPIWMVKTRMQLLADGAAGQRAYKSYGEVISTIMKEEGVGGFYKGIFASYWGCAEGALQFTAYEKLKRRLLRKQNDVRASQGLPPSERLPQSTYFWAAAASKCMASIVTYPHEVARTRLREQARDGIFKYHGMWQTIALVAKEEGWQTLYSGMGIHLAKVVPNSAIMFLTYEVVNHWLDRYEVVEG